MLNSEDPSKCYQPFAVIGGDNACHINSQMTFNNLTDADGLLYFYSRILLKEDRTEIKYFCSGKR